MDQFKAKIRSVPDFPKPGILFYDITTLLKDREGFRDAVAAIANDPVRRSALFRLRRQQDLRKAVVATLWQSATDDGAVRPCFENNSVRRIAAA